MSSGPETDRAYSTAPGTRTETFGTAVTGNLEVVDALPVTQASALEH